MYYSYFLYNIICINIVGNITMRGTKKGIYSENVFS